MKAFIEWIMTNWPLILLAVSMVAGLANLITKHWGEENPGLKKVLLFILDLCSIIQSKGSPLQGFKLPLVTSPPSEKAIRKIELKSAVKEIKES